MARDKAANDAAFMWPAVITLTKPAPIRPQHTKIIIFMNFATFIRRAFADVGAIARA
ncbi:hypothetical protein ARTHRO9V_230078 [Arthrobacter sp. 9V]|nr:hypothetical protein ARTHRO9V_230078 [Arthrobacter sp. 9V]